MEGFEKDDYETVGFHVSFVFTLMYFWNFNHSLWLFYIVKVAEAVLKDYIFVHLENNHDKFNLLMWVSILWLSFVNNLPS